MDENTPTKTVSFKDLIGKKDVSISGCGTYLIGLSTKGDVAIETTDDDLCMVLLTLTLNENGGCTFSPANTDLPCYVNASEDPLSGETHLIDGTKIEVADKRLMFIDGPIPKRRRKLPPTPGTLVGGPPAKPTRDTNSGLNGDTKTTDATGIKPVAGEAALEINKDADAESSADKRWLETSWCMLDLADAEQNMFRNLHTPEQISILAASYFAKQLRMFTDATVTAQLLDNIFKLCTETIDYCKDVYMNYLSDISQALAKVPDRSNTRPMHGPAVRFLTELLKQCMDPVERVILILDLLRTFSHFDNNMATMVRYQTTAAVLGSISVYLDVIEVQQYGIDILAKIATYKPSLDKKAPMREVGIDMVIRSVNYHSTNLALSRSTCRVLANIASTLITVLNSWLDTESSAESTVSSTVEQYDKLLEYVFKEGIPVIQAIMKSFGSDLGVNTEGRKFIFYYAKLQQLQLKKAKWLRTKDVDNGPVEAETDKPKQEDTDESGEEADDNISDTPTSQNELLSGETKEEDTQSILKKVGSYENLRTAEKRLVFAGDTVGGSDSEVTYSSASENELGESFSGDVTVPVDIDEDFSTHVVHHLVRKTIKKRKQSSSDTAVEADISDSESESEFLQSLTVKPKLEETDSPVQKTNESASSGATQNVNETLKENNSENSHTTASLREESANMVEKQTSVTENSYVLVDGNEESEPFSRKDNTGNVTENDIVDDKSESQTERSDGPSGNTNQEPDGTHGDSGASSRRDSGIRQSAIIDVTFLGKLVRTQIVTYVGSLVFRGEDSMVLMVIDKPIGNLLEDASAPPGLLEFAGSQYGANMTLMDLEPAIVISVIDAVRYRSVTKDLVQSAILSLTRTMNEKLLADTLNTTMLFYKSVFSDEHLQTILTEEEFVKEFRTCFQNATQRMEKSHSVEELRKNLASLHEEI